MRMALDQQAARTGLMKFLAKQGGALPMRELHTHSLVFYQAGHQAFSELMEGLVADELVAFDDGVFRLTDKGRQQIGDPS
jgi:hypothetical protein